MILLIWSFILPQSCRQNCRSLILTALLEWRLLSVQWGRRVNAAGRNVVSIKICVYVCVYAGTRVLYMWFSQQVTKESDKITVQKEWMAFELICVNMLAIGLEYFHNGMKYSSLWWQWSQNIISHFTERISQCPVKSTGVFSLTSIVTEPGLQ